jgi:hypothetical protein
MRPETSQGDRPRPQSIMQIQPQQYQEADTRDILPELQPVLGFLNAHSHKVYNEGYFMKLADLRPGESAQFPWRFYIVCARAKGAEDSEERIARGVQVGNTAFAGSPDLRDLQRGKEAGFASFPSSAKLVRFVGSLGFVRILTAAPLSHFRCSPRFRF